MYLTAKHDLRVGRGKVIARAGEEVKVERVMVEAVRVTGYDGASYIAAASELSGWPFTVTDWSGEKQ